VSVIPGAVFSGGLDGRLRAYAPTDGKVLWEFDTVGPFKAVNGGEARGGAIDYGGQVVANGMLYVHSGSMRQAGNALLAFGLRAR
jgi:polyvinyl alcohol dehydrogenase (cytochrome)